MRFLIPLLLLFAIGQPVAQNNRVRDSLFGSITKERAWWNLLHYDLEVELFPEKKAISGRNQVKFQVLKEGELMQIGFNMKGYWGEEKKSREAFSEGWLHSGDVVRRDEDGFHYFVDRLKFMIRKGGENISAFEIEDVLNSYPGVSESSVVPVPDPLREEEIKAFILNKMDSAYHFGEIELLVYRDDAIRAKKLIEDFHKDE